MKKKKRKTRSSVAERRLKKGTRYTDSILLKETRGERKRERVCVRVREGEGASEWIERERAPPPRC